MYTGYTVRKVSDSSKYIDYYVQLYTYSVNLTLKLLVRS